MNLAFAVMFPGNCADGSTSDANGICADGSPPDMSMAEPCPGGVGRDTNGICSSSVPITPMCPNHGVHDAAGNCIEPCPASTIRGPSGNCIPENGCQSGFKPDLNGNCIDMRGGGLGLPPPPPCPNSGSLPDIRDKNGNCYEPRGTGPL